MPADTLTDELTHQNIQGQSDKRRYVRMNTVFPITLEIVGDQNKTVFQAFTRDVSSGGMCIELSTSEAAASLLKSGTFLKIIINTTFQNNPIHAVASIAWITRRTDNDHADLVMGIQYTSIDAKSGRRILKHAQRLLWAPRSTALLVLFLAALSCIFYFYNEKLISQNRKLMVELVDSAKQKSEISQNLLNYQSKALEYDNVVRQSRQTIRDLEQKTKLSAASSKQIDEYKKQIDELKAKKKQADEELIKLKSAQSRLASEYSILKKSESASLADLMKQMYEWLSSHQNIGTSLVASFEGDPDLEEWCFTYDQSLACQTFLLFGDRDKAADVLKFFEKRAVREKGLFINAYDSVDGSAKEKMVHVGPNLWIGIAALQYEYVARDGKYISMAESIGDWLIQFQDIEGGLRGGPDVTWYSTEHHLDAYAFFDMLYKITQKAKYSEARDRILAWIKKYAYSSKDRRMNRGKGDSTIATDTFAWAIAALGPETLTANGFDAEEILKYAEQHCAVTIQFPVPGGSVVKVKGFDFAKAKNLGRGGIISPEWTSQMIVSYQIMADYFKKTGDTEKASYYSRKADFYLNELQRLVITSPSRIGKGKGCLPYASQDNADTGHGWRTPKGTRTGSVAGTAYGLFAWSGYNPFELGGFRPGQKKLKQS